MSEITKTTTHCDVCDHIIERPDRHGMIWPMADGGQLWPTEDGDKDVCAECCGVLLKSADLGMIEIEKMAYFHERAGFVQRDDHWVLDPIVITRNDLIQAIHEYRADKDLPCSSG